MPIERELVKVGTTKLLESESLAEIDEKNTEKVAAEMSVEDKTLDELQSAIKSIENIKPESRTADDEARLVGYKVLYAKQRKAKIARVLDRGFINERLEVELPPELHGEWVRDDSIEIDRMRALGFEVDKQYATKRSLHSGGDATAKVGDVIFMVCSKEDYMLQEEVRRERFEQMHGKPGKRDKQLEERAFEGQVKTETPEVPVIDDSHAREAEASDIRAAVEAS
jgi:hypothetical protein